MNAPFVNRRDLDFLLYEFTQLETLLSNSIYEDFDREAITSILDTAEAIATDKYEPCASKLDANEPHFDGMKVSMMPEVASALEAYREAGFFSIGADVENGGMGLPYVVAMAASGIFSAANVGISSYHFLTSAAANMLAEFGSKAQKNTYLTPMLEGRWFGTMCLSEPQAGSSLSDIKTKATPTDEGHYLIEGSKMWISGGDHELSENIVEMVLAKIPGSPPGVKGISLFIVPKYRVNEDGSIGEKNNIALAGLNHKMGHRGTTNCLLNFGEAGECHGYLVGEANQGLRYMFHMMNEARLGVGYGSVMSGLCGFLYSIDYARNRPQGRHPQDKDPNSPQIMISEHTDVKRLLLAQKAYVEGAQALIFYCASLIDQNKLDPEDKQNDTRRLLLEILTPVAKSWPSEFCLEANKMAIQVLGGYGYTREYPVERYYRDNRLNHIHEGTHGIQGMDLLGRKVSMFDGAALKILLDQMQDTISKAEAVPDLAVFASGLQSAVNAMLKATQTVLACEDLNIRLANATRYLDAFGHVVIGWIWLQQAMIAQSTLERNPDEDTAFYKGKLAACQFFFKHELPKVHVDFNLVESLDETCLELEVEHLSGK